MDKQPTLGDEILRLAIAVSQTIELGSPRHLRRMALEGFLGSSYPRRRVGQALSSLKYRGYVEVRDGVITLTPKGRDRVKQRQIESLVLDTKQPWDGRWRVIIWDVPELRRSARDRIRAALKKLGFVRIQRSVWVTPYPCRDQIAYLREEMGLAIGLVYLESDFIEDHGRLRRYFKLLEPTVEE